MDSIESEEERKTQRLTTLSAWLAVAHVLVLVGAYAALGSASRHGAGLLIGLISGPLLALATVSTLLLSFVVFILLILFDRTQKRYFPILITWVSTFLFWCAFNYYVFYLQGR